MPKFFAILVIFALSIDCYSQSYWRIQNENGEELLLTIRINETAMTYEAHTRKDALKEMAGSVAFMLAKTAGKLRYPEIVHSAGKIAYLADTIFYDGSFDYLDKTFPLKAKSWNNQFLGVLTDNRNKTHLLTGRRAGSDQQLEDYSSIVIQAFNLTEKYYWDKGLVKSSDWEEFKSKVNDFKSKISDDYELNAVLFWNSKKTAFAPFEIKRITQRELPPKQEKPAVVRQVRPGVGLLDLNDLPEAREKMCQIFRDIQNREYTALILDARGRKNLKLISAVLLAEQLTLLPADWGLYLTRKWLDGQGKIPQAADYSRLFQNGKIPAPNGQEIYREEGRFMKPIPEQTAFFGKIYLLIDQRTSRIAEALAVWLKNDKIATIAGTKSAGQPMLFETVSVAGNFRLSIPVAQFYDVSGKTWYGAGVEPDILTDEDALTAVLKQIKVNKQ